MANDRLEREITELASHIHAATCRWLGLVAEFDRRGGWSAWACRSCAEWISWRCSIAPGAAREHVRVARRLEALPLVRAAFAEGRLSYSKVRALTRVDNVEKEAELLALARHATASQLERMVRGYRSVVLAERAAASGRPERCVTWSYADDGSLLLRARLPVEEGAVVLQALEAAVERLRGDGVSAETRGAAGFVGAGDAVGVSAETREPAGLAVVADGETPAVAGTSDRVDVSAETCDAAAAPPADGGDRVSAETDPTASELRADGLVLMADTLLANAPVARGGGDRFQVVLHVDAATLAGGDDGRCELADGELLAPETARRLTCDAAVVPLLERGGRALSVGRKTRSVPPALRRALASRDRGCRFPGCTNRYAIDAHHVRHWAHGGPTSLDNLVQLCRHHHRLLHEGGYTVERTGSGFAFRRADGREIRAVPPAPRGRTRCLREDNRRRGRIHPEACVPESYDRMDLGRCVDVLIDIAPLQAPGI
jgi:Domain of unknown function (DUF222)/HNH endonuclease